MIQATLIFEMIGRPAEHVKDTMNKLIDVMANQNFIKIKSKRVAEPKKIEEKELYSTFAEIDIEIDSLHNLSLFVLTYMPSHVEIVSPGELKLKNSEMNSLLNEITLRMHKYDEIAKTLGIEREIMRSQILKMKQESESLAKSSKKKNKKSKKKKRIKK